ncbi:hypothetical protein CLIB1444_15S00144 [[Candida] jaroonii]|uniref:Uncharacterized protein n=1 Tax=[Candida] jaroonii TaxID=467808 RepID=A0ACA9YE81_9ASCO|nr:hypothetical protein CLIB1444_15S00144 [[Candida] jaroonii]
MLKKTLFFLLLVTACLSFPTLIENVNFGLVDWLRKDLSDINFESLIQNDYEFVHGVASGDSTNDSVILWTRISPSIETTDDIPVFLSISEDKLFKNQSTFTVVTNQKVDYTVKVDITGLLPNRDYYYQFFALSGRSSRIGHTKTFPNENDIIEEIKFSVHSCSNYAGGFFTAYAMSAIKESVDFVIHLGDYIYEYENGKYTNGTDIGRTHFPNKELYELDDYRQRYGSYRLDEDLQLSHGDYPWVVVWDDHELADNSWLRGSVNTQGIEYVNRRNAFLQAYHEWMPIRPQENLSKIWRPFNFGDLADLFMIDTRHYSRDVTDTYDNGDYIASIADRPERTMMGFDQEEWLYTSLNKSNATWKLIGSQTVVNSISFEKIGEIIGDPFTERNYDSFDGYTANRKRFIDAIVENDLQNVILFSGDFHISWVHEIFSNSSTYNFQSGKGSSIVEFAVTGTSSPTTFPKNYTIEQCYDVSELLVSSNEGVVWNEGWFRGYSEVNVNKDELVVKFYGVDVKNNDREEVLLATFAVDKNTNHVRRDFNDVVAYGYLDKKLS